MEETGYCYPGSHEADPMTMLEERLAAAPILPLIQADDPGTAVRIGEALVAGGLTVVEVVLRTDAALRCLEAVCHSVPDAVVGAGTVLNRRQADAAVEAGARFLVSPGLDEGVVALAAEHALPAFPGVATATEIQRAWNLGLRTVKFFPAETGGGTAMIKALGAAFREMRFIPTGGISAANLAEYLALPQVAACGGSWIVPGTAIAGNDYAKITALAAEAVAIAAGARSRKGHG
jgi:2-dehydro-3-deoxyphosphogluconate aldolase/(4S)-4-hydroxy-2-oxoglutarate aldolase